MDGKEFRDENFRLAYEYGLEHENRLAEARVKDANAGKQPILS